MFLRELFENDSAKHAAFCFGRMNPPTVGHQQLINAVAKAGHGGDFFIFTSQSQDPKKNPLDYETKVRFLRALYPDIASHIVYEPGLKTIMHVAQWLYKNGYRNVTFVAGSDRLADFKELLEKYNGVEGPNGMYKFNRINFVSSGERDPDSEGVAGVSASAARAAAAAGDYEAFAQAVGGGKLTQQLYNAVRQGMLVESNYGNQRDQAIQKQHEWHNTERSDANFVFNGYTAKFKDDGLYIYRGGDLVKVKKGNYLPVTNKSILSAKTMISHLPKSVSEDASGYIPKNKKEAKDPRWSNALSVDVTPETPAKNARAFRLI